jgi:hypothetical protein
MAKEFTITVSGETQSDIEAALEEVLKLVREGYLSGVDSNESGEYSFDSTGEYKENERG